MDTHITLKVDFGKNAGEVLVFCPEIFLIGTGNSFEVALKNMILHAEYIYDSLKNSEDEEAMYCKRVCARVMVLTGERFPEDLDDLCNELEELAEDETDNGYEVESDGSEAAEKIICEEDDNMEVD